MHQIIQQGTRIHKYTVDKLLGSGAAGTVYLGYDDDKNEVAIKHQKYFSEKEIEIYKFMKGSPRFKNINNIYDFEEEGEKLWVIMEYLSGPDLTTYSKSIKQEEIPEMLYQICHGIYELHAQKLIHRDLKPDNMMVHDQNGVKSFKIVDLGLACVQKDSQKMTKTGTPVYMAPELWDDSGEINDKGYTNAVDIWALGMIIYEFFNQKNLITGYNEKMVREQVNNLQITPELLKKIPPKYQQIVEGCLQQDAEQRLKIDDILILLDKDRFEHEGKQQKILNFSTYEQQQNIDKKIFTEDEQKKHIKSLAILRAFFRPNNKDKNDTISKMCYEMARMAAVSTNIPERNNAMRDLLNEQIDLLFAKTFL